VNQVGDWTLGPSRALSLSQRILKRAAARMGKQIYSPPAGPFMPFESCDLVVVTGGDILSSDYGSFTLLHNLKPVEWASQRGIPSAILAHSIGPFKSKEEIDEWKRVASRATLITVREPLSYRYLIEDLGFSPSKVILTGDTAFLLEPDGDVKKNQFHACEKPTVAVSISEGICGWTGGDYVRHIDVWVHIIRMMITDWDATVVAIPHVQEPWADDRTTATKVWKKLDYDQRFRVIGEELNAAQYKAIISGCEFVLAERMHAAIAGFSSGVCTVPIGYSVKAKGITQFVFGDSDIQADDLVLDLHEFMDLDISKSRLTQFWNGRVGYATAIEKELPRMRAGAESNFDLLLSRL
jgi:colanic acid/amylovoran biosynthesis protein